MTPATGYAVEPGASGWQAWAPADMAGWLRRALPSSGGLILVDGRSGSGKTTLARRLADTLGASIVHTDDLAWHHDPMEWSSLLLDGVLAPWRSGDAVSLRPPAWERLG